MRPKKNKGLKKSKKNILKFSKWYSKHTGGMFTVDSTLTFDPVKVSTYGGSDLVKNIQNATFSFNTEDGDIYLFAADSPRGRTPIVYIMQGDSALQQQLDGSKYGLDAGETNLKVTIDSIQYSLFIKVMIGMSGNTWIINGTEFRCPIYQVLKILPLKADDTAPVDGPAAADDDSDSD